MGLLRERNILLTADLCLQLTTMDLNLPIPWGFSASSGSLMVHFFLDHLPGLSTLF